MNSMRLRSKWVTTAGFAALAAVGACNVREELLSPQQPGTILPSDISGAGPAGAEALRVGALGRFQQITPGGGTGNQSEATMLGDLLTDVWKSGDTFSQHNDTDQRSIATNNSVLSVAYSDLTRSRVFYRDAIAALNAASPERKGAIAEQWFIMGYSEMLLAELFCNGTPIGETVNGQYVLGKPKTNEEVYAIALTHLDSAITIAASGVGTTADGVLATSIRNAASVAKGRVLVNLARFTDAAAAVAGVPTSYTYNVTFSEATNSNNIWGLAGQVSIRARFVVGDSFDIQGTLKNALPFASAKDPRVPAVGNPLPANNNVRAIDGVTPLVYQNIWATRNDAIPVATGIDARLIEAEAKLRANDVAGMMTTLNVLRTSPQVLGPLSVPAMAALPAPAAGDPAVMLFFREKAFWQFGRGNRLGDIRRLIRVYGKNAEDVLPTGRFHKSGGSPYGVDVNLPVTDNEKQNPNFTGCIDRRA